MLIEIHMIQNHSPANLNRDDLGAPRPVISVGITFPHLQPMHQAQHPFCPEFYLRLSERGLQRLEDLIQRKNGAKFLKPRNKTKSSKKGKNPRYPRKPKDKSKGLTRMLDNSLGLTDSAKQSENAAAKICSQTALSGRILRQCWRPKS